MARSSTYQCSYALLSPSPLVFKPSHVTNVPETIITTTTAGKSSTIVLMDTLVNPPNSMKSYPQTGIGTNSKRIGSNFSGQGAAPAHNTASSTIFPETERAKRSSRYPTTTSKISRGILRRTETADSILYSGSHEAADLEIAASIPVNVRLKKTATEGSNRHPRRLPRRSSEPNMSVNHSLKGRPFTRSTRSEPAFPEDRRMSCSSSGRELTDWTIPAILSALYCNIFCGAFAVFFAFKENKAANLGKFEEAERHSKNARIFTIISLITGIIIALYWIIYLGKMRSNW